MTAGHHTESFRAYFGALISKSEFVNHKYLGNVKTKGESNPIICWLEGS